jgi:hypothetical protein
VRSSTVSSGERRANAAAVASDEISLKLTSHSISCGSVNVSSCTAAKQRHHSSTASGHSRVHAQASTHRLQATALQDERPQVHHVGYERAQQLKRRRVHRALEVVQSDEQHPLRTRPSQLFETMRACTATRDDDNHDHLRTRPVATTNSRTALTFITRASAGYSSCLRSGLLRYTRGVKSKCCSFSRCACSAAGYSVCTAPAPSSRRRPRAAAIQQRGRQHTVPPMCVSVQGGATAALPHLRANGAVLIRQHDNGRLSVIDVHTGAVHAALQREEHLACTLWTRW